MKKQITDWEKIFTVCLSDKGLAWRTLTVNNNYKSTYSEKKIIHKRTIRNIKRCLTALFIEKCKLKS